MKATKLVITVVVLTLVFSCAIGHAAELKVHSVFGNNMVLQRDKPIKIWGWATKGEEITVAFGKESATTKATGEQGLWEVTFPAQAANPEAQKLIVKSTGKSIEMENIVVGDIWVMNGQSNMAFGLGKTLDADMESAQANLPLLRRFGISPNEQSKPQMDIRAEAIQGEGWTLSTPTTAGRFSAIGFSYGARLQRALQIPIGIIDNSRGGAAIESLVPPHKFKDDPIAATYKAYLDKRIAEFDPAKIVEKQWQKQVARLRSKGVAEDKLPKKGGVESLRSWSIPGKSPSDAASCYNGMFGVFKGLNIKGVLFHQGYNNAMSSNCRPKRYRALVRLMVEGWRDDFNDPALPVGVIGFCAGSIPQTRDNFETWSLSPAAYIREAQRLGLSDLNDPDHVAFLPAYDIQIPGLHTHKKLALAVRAARWALNKVYDMKINWDSAALLSAEPDGERMLLTFDKGVMPDDMSMVLEGFSIADKSGRFFMAHAEYPIKKDAGVWNTANKSCETTKIYVSSPLVKHPLAVRYAWATSPMGNLKINGKEWLPLQSFRTDSWDWPEAGPETNAVDRAKSKVMKAEAARNLEFRKHD